MKKNILPIKNILVVYKKSAYKIYFLEKRSSFYKKQKTVPPKQLSALKKAHEAHYGTLNMVRQTLREKGVPFRCLCRGRTASYDTYDLIISVGGDGTFLESARNVRGHLILGVNSDPGRSVGKFCTATPMTFLKILEEILSGNVGVRLYHRFCLSLRNKKVNIDVLNDILIAHSNPGAMSRYCLSIGEICEEQRSSGLWISTATGSTGAICSAGGKILPWNDKRIQYMPRELYRRHGAKKKLLGGIPSLKQSVVIQSLMRQGVICVDGEHLRFDFGFGEIARIKPSKSPLHVIVSG